MSEENNTPEEVVEEQSQQPDELTLLKQRADIMGIQYHPSIGVDKLKAKIEAHTTVEENPYAGEELETIQAAEQTAADMQVPARKYPSPAQLKAARKNKALKLVRVRVTCMNPNKSNMKGDIFSTGNSEIGMVKKYVPFNAEQGWHVPQIILDMLRSKKFSTFYEVKEGNKKIKRQKLVPEYAIEIMPPLTHKQLQELKQRQLMAQGQ